MRLRPVPSQFFAFHSALRSRDGRDSVVNRRNMETNTKCLDLLGIVLNHLEHSGYYMHHLLGKRSRCSDWLRAGRLRGRSSSPGRVSFLHVVQTGSGAHQASHTKGTGGSFPGVNLPGREADHSPPTSAEVKKTWIYTSTPPYAFMV
jgi:hypothetical protein